LRQRLDDLTQKSKDLESVGLSPTDSVGEFEDLDLATVNVRAFMKVYIEDTQRKLAVLEPLRVKLQLFTEFLRQHYGRKYIKIVPDRGFVIMVAGEEPSELLPSRLSSGEQQILVLAHEILFKATPRTLVLIDEPELSLHVLWQASFVEDLAQMGRVNNLSFLLATHSPTLIGGRDDLKRSLDVIGRES
jgi:ABC-type glutathione transport system ATPase component